MGANTPRAGWVTGGTKKVSPKVWGARLMPYSAPPDRKHSLNPVDDQSRPGILRLRCNIKTLSTARTTNGAQPLTCSWVVSAAAGSNIYIYIYIYIYSKISQGSSKVSKCFGTNSYGRQHKNNKNN